MITFHPGSVLSVAASVAGGQEYPPATLYVVATPIGNLADISLRALHLLSLVDAVACEDTRHSVQLLRHWGISKPTFALHQHNECEAALEVVSRLARGERVACVSDAGTPAISDPGARVAAKVREAGFRVVPIPGVSSVMAALSAAGVEGQDGFRFVGFLPAQAHARDLALHYCAQACETQVLFEAPHRIVALGALLAVQCPQRRVSLCRELTKQFESIDTMLCEQVPHWLAGNPQRLRGEFVLVLHAQAMPGLDEQRTKDLATLKVLLRDLPLKHAVDLAAEITGSGRKGLYAQALKLRQQDTPPSTLP